jgi:protein-S-isoprenylcysteine O-methyltransferase Ste14
MALSARRTPGVSNRSRENLILIVPLLGLLALRLVTRAWGSVTPLDVAMDLAGMALLLTGLAIRVCARQWKAERSHDGLVTDGLYGYVRHPLYLGSFLLGTGICLLLGDAILLAAYVALFWLSHGSVIRREEAELERVFGETYSRYRRRVPALIPNTLSISRRIVPRRRREAVLRECDAICVWLALPLLIQLGEAVALSQSYTSRDVGAWYAAACGGALVTLVLLWLRLKPEYREMIRDERARHTA